MSVQQCEECRLALVRTVFDPVAGESDSWACQLDDTFSVQTRDVECPFYVDWSHQLPPPARSCKKSAGEIDGCSTTKSSGCGSCSTSGGCGSGGCGVGDPADALDAKWDPEEAYVADEVAEAALQAQSTYFRLAAHDHDEHGEDHDHGREQVGEGPTEGDTRHRPGPEVMEPRPISPTPEAPRVEPAPGVAGDPSIPDGHAPDAPDDGYPTEPARQTASATAAACGAMKALERMGLGRDEDAPVPIPLEDELD